MAVHSRTLNTGNDDYNIRVTCTPTNGLRVGKFVPNNGPAVRCCTRSKNNEIAETNAFPGHSRTRPFEKPVPQNRSAFRTCVRESVITPPVGRNDRNTDWHFVVIHPVVGAVGREFFPFPVSDYTFRADNAGPISRLNDPGPKLSPTSR